MNYRQIFSKAWRITRENPYLWFFGFLAGLSLGSNNSNLNNSFIQGGAWLFQNLSNLLSMKSALSLTFLIVSILLWVAGTFARIGLIHEVSAFNSRYGKPLANIKEVFRTSAQLFLPIVSMQLLIWSPVIILSVVYGFLAQSFIITSFSNMQSGTSLGDFWSFGTIWLFGCGTILLSIPLTFVDAFAYRSVVLEKMGVKNSIRYAIDIVKGNVGSILSLSIIVGVIGFIFTLILMLVLSPLLLLMMKPMMDSVSQCSLAGNDFNAVVNCMQQMNTSPSILIPSLIASILSAAITSLWVTFQSATFTLAYHKLKE